jgi:hypothetical protein
MTPLSRLIALLLVAAFGLNAVAQDFPNTFTTSGGLSVGVPEGYEAQELLPGAVGVLEPVSEEAVIIFTSDALLTFGLPTGSDAQVIMTAFSTQGDFSEMQDVELSIGKGFFASGVVPGLDTNGTVYAIDADFGLIVAIVTARSGEISAAFGELALQIIDSVTFDPGAVATSEPVEEPTFDPEVIDGDCPIAVSAMPEGVVQFCAGVEFTLPQGWAISGDSVDTIASVSTKEFSVNVTASVSEINSFFNPSLYKTESMAYLAEAYSYTSYDAETSWQVLKDEDGVKVEVYDPRVQETLEENAYVTITYLVTLNKDLFVTYTVGFLPQFARESDVELAQELVLSTVLNDSYTGEPVLLDVDGKDMFVNELTCNSSSYMFGYTGEGRYLVRCGACAGDESSVWGTDIFTDDSSVCLAAAHAGVTQLSEGGTFFVDMLGGQTSYTGSTANGVTSRDYGEWGGSFSVAPLEE